MKKLFLITPILFALMISQHLFAQNQPPVISIQSAIFSPVDSLFTLTYDLSDVESDSIEILFQISDDQGVSYSLQSQNVTGDVGFPVFGGMGKTLTWKADTILDKINSRIRLIADDKQINIQNLVDQVDPTRLVAALNVIAGPRNPLSSLAHLEEVKDTIENRFIAAGLNTSRSGKMVQVYGMENIIGKHKGLIDESKVYIVDAHFDGVANSPGADDNGSGVVGMLECMNILSQYNFDKTIHFIGFDLEEFGLLGSKHYVDEGGLEASEQVQAVLNFEMIGFYDTTAGSQSLPPGFNILFSDLYNEVAADGFRGNFITNVGNVASSSLVDKFDSCAAAYVPDLIVRSLAVPGNGEIATDLRRSDHASFWDGGYQALMLTDGANFRNDNYHTVNDSIGSLDFTFMSQVTAATVATIAELAGLQNSNMETSSIELMNTSIDLEIECEISMLPIENGILLNISQPACLNGKTRMRLLDLGGKELQSKPILSGQSQTRISFSGLAAGIYLVSLELENGIFSKKIMVR